MRLGVILLAVLLAGCEDDGSSADAADEGLAGVWLGTNYQCPIGVVHEERVRIALDGMALTATKIDGDDCVAAGEVTFYGAPTAIRCVTGVPGEPQPGEYPGAIEQSGPDRFTACGVTFERQ